MISKNLATKELSYSDKIIKATSLPRPLSHFKEKSSLGSKTNMNGRLSQNVCYLLLDLLNQVD